MFNRRKKITPPEQAVPDLTIAMRKSEKKTDQPWYWVIIASNGEVLATSEMYHAYEDCWKAMKLVKAGASQATLASWRNIG